MAEGIQTHERRRSPRISVNFPVTMTWGKKKYNCQALEFSEFGVLLASNHKELLGQDVEIGMAFDSRAGALTLKGLVAYTTEKGMGVRFKELTDAQMSELKGYVSSLSNRA